MENSHKQKISLLALSFALVSTFSISAAVPQMREYYAGYSADKIDLLISMPSFAILLVMIVNVFWSSYLSEHLMVIGGLILYVTAGLMPLFCRDYTFVLVTRFLMGTGTGMVNSRAVSAISERYEGKNREKLLGYRGSVEALGNAVLTMIAGLLLMTGWKNVFYIYGVGIIILILYLTGVPAEKQKQRKSPTLSGKSGRLSGALVRHVIGLAFIAFLMIGANTVLTMRIPVFMVEDKMGTDTFAGMLLTCMIISSIVSGILYERLKEILKKYFLLAMLLGTSLGMIIVSLAGHVAVLSLAALLFGFCYAVVVTEMFEKLSESIPENQITKGTVCILIGCNLGAFGATYIMKLVSLLSDNTRAPIWFYVILILAAAIGQFIKWNRSKAH